MILSDFLEYTFLPLARGELKIFNFYLLLISYYIILYRHRSFDRVFRGKILQGRTMPFRFDPM